MVSLTLPLGLGTYGWDYSPEVIEKAIYEGVELIDTAETYGYGKVEKELGKILVRLDRVPLIATKVSRNHMSKKAVLAAAKRSRDNLQIDRIQLYQLHWPSPKVPWEETFEALGELVETKVIQRVGVSNMCLGQVVKAQTLAKENGFELSCLQTRLNLQDPSANQWLIPKVLKAGLTVLAYSPLAQGKLKKQVKDSLKFVLASGAVPLVKTNSTIHLEEILKLVKQGK